MAAQDAPTRREVLATAAGLAAAAAFSAAEGFASVSDRPAPPASGGGPRMPVLYIPHGGGPWPWMPPFTPQLGRDYAPLRRFLEEIPARLPARPTAVLVISAHWEAPLPTVTVDPRPRLVYDYHGFPVDTYRIAWPAPGDPGLAGRVRERLAAAGIPSATSTRGFDHGTFVPMKLAFPDADVPTVQLSLDPGYDAAQHLAIGRALAPLRDEGVLIVGSGMSWEAFRAADVARRSMAFDAWFQDVARADPARDRALAAWTEAPFARVAHPHEEHLLPMMVAAGAAGADRGAVRFSGSLLGIRVSGVEFGGPGPRPDYAETGA